MACEIKIITTLGYIIQGDFKQIYIEGTATDCQTIKVTVTCEDFQLLPQEVPVNPQGKWLVYFENLPAACRCNGKVTVRAECVDNEECFDEDQRFDLVCVDKVPVGPPTQVCPSIDWDCLVGDCQDDGTRMINVSAELTGVSNISAELRDSANLLLDSKPPSQGPVKLQGSHAYPGGSSQKFSVNVISPPRLWDSLFPFYTSSRLSKGRSDNNTN